MNNTIETLVDIIDLIPISDREAEIIKLRLQGKTLQEIGNSFGVTRDRIRQVEEKGMRKFKHFIIRNKVKNIQ